MNPVSGCREYRCSSRAIRTLAALLAAKMLLAVPVVAAGEPGERGTVVVTATRTERLLEEVPLSIDVVTSEEMRRQPARTLADHLKDIPGVSVSDGSIGGLARVNIRGEGGARVLVLVDGVRISEQKSMDGAQLLVDPAAIERVEIVKGPGSVLYGSEAIGGVVNIITKKGGEKPLEGSAFLTYDGSNNGLTPYLALAGRQNGFSWRLSGSYSDADDRRDASGRIDRSSYRRRNLNTYLDYSWSGGRAGVQYEHFWTDTEIPLAVSNGTEVDLDLPRWQRDKVSVFTELTEVTENLARLRADLYWQNVYKSFTNDIRPAGAPIYSFLHTRNDQDSYGAVIQSEWALGLRHYLVAGVDLYRDDLRADEFRERRLSPGPPFLPGFPQTSNYRYEGTQDMLALFVQDEWQFHPHWTLTMGLRQTWVESSLDRTTNPALERRRQSDNHPVGSLGLVYGGLENWRLRALYSSGYRFPTLQSLFIGTVHGSANPTLPNPGLDPETSHNFELGARYHDGSLSLDLALFYNLADDYITTTAIDASTRQYTNIDEARTAGVELQLSRTLEPWNLTPYCAMAYLYREFDGAMLKTSRTGHPRWTGRLGLRGEGHLPQMAAALPLHGDLFLRWASSAREKTATASIEDPGWMTLNLGLGTRIGRQRPVHVNLNLNNLLDKRFREARNSINDPARHLVVSVGWDF